MMLRQFNQFNLLYAAVYLILVLLATPAAFPWWFKVSFWLFAAFFLWIGRDFKSLTENTYRTQRVVWLAIILLIVSRLAPFVHWGEAPFGYDTGIYLRGFEEIIRGYSKYPLSFVVYSMLAIGFSANSILHVFIIFFNVLLGLSLYTAVKSIFRHQIAALAALLIFALSIAQYEAYVWMFYRMMISVMLFMVTIALVARQSWLAILTGGFAGALHPATFLVFGLSYAVYTLVMAGRWFWVKRIKDTLDNKVIKKIIITGFGILVLALLVNWHELYGYLPYIIERRLQLSNFEPFLSNELTGLYLNFTAFRMSTLFYTPLGLLGAWLLLKRIRDWWGSATSDGLLFFLSFFITTAALIGGKIIFHQRYLIIFDLLVIVFAGLFLAQLISYFGGTKWGGVLLGVFVAGFSSVILYYSWTREPWIWPNELQELKSAALQLEPNAYGMSTDAYYTPWVYGYLTERTIAPGYFINYWTLPEWEKFWYKGTNEERVDMLGRYGNNPIYIFVGSKQKANEPMREFLDKYSEKVSTHIWRYPSSKNQP